MSEDDGFLSRWARRKAEIREAEAAEAIATEQAVVSDQPAELDDRNRPATEEEIAALPDPDKLEHGADFKPFLRPGVPQALRQRALRRIWRVNPAIGFLDGMNEYDLDYTDAATVVDNLKTAYQVGRGFVFPEEEETPAETANADKPAAPSEEAPAQDPAGESGDAQPASAALTEPEDAEEIAVSLEPEMQDSGAQDEVAALAEVRVPAQPAGRAAARRWQRFST